jgi:hypothetical protein
MIDNPLNRLKVKRGSELPHAKLTESDVLLIRSLVEHREHLKDQARMLTNQRIAEKFGVHQRTIDRITAGESWNHVA